MTAEIPVSEVRWSDAVRIVRDVHPPIDLFEDIADPSDWPLLLSAARKTDPRRMETIGNLDLVPPHRRVSGPGASRLMAPFTHISTDRPSRFSDGTYGVLYVGDSFEVALFETVHHHGRFMARTRERAGWAASFLELRLDVVALLHDLRGPGHVDSDLLDADSYDASQVLGARLRAAGADGLVYPSVRRPGGDCAGLFYPDRTSTPVPGRRMDYHWDGVRVDLYRDSDTGAVYRILP